MFERQIKMRTSFFLFFLPVVMIFILSGYLFLFNFFQQDISIINIVATFMFFDKFILEFFIIFVISIILINCKWFIALIGYILIIGFLAVNIIQLAAVYISGEFVSRLALDNLADIHLFINFTNLFILIIILLIFILLPLFITFIIKKLLRRYFKNRSIILILLIIILAGISFKLYSEHLPEIIQKKVKSYYMKRNIGHVSSLIALLDSFGLVKSNNNVSSLNLEGIGSLSRSDIEFLSNNISRIDISESYPLIKENIFEKSPFNKNKNNNVEKPNIIIFFTEGLSARTLSVYNDKFSELTPNLYDFSKDSMVVNNYYNHTAATYRGILGQVCSIYPVYGGGGGWQDNYNNIPKVNYYGLTDVLKDSSYDTIFFNPYLKKITSIDDMVTQIGFDSVLSAEELSEKFLKGTHPVQGSTISDQQLYSALIGFLKKKNDNNVVNTNQQQINPFLLALYSSETHAWFDVKTDGKKFFQGNHNTLNTIHNLDDAFGKFWRYYINSSYSKNTIIIFTTDHAHFYEKSYVQLMKTVKENDYQQLFIDKIPLIIYDPTRNLPKTFNVNNATSIDFAPSIVHYLGLKNKKNPFIGESIFSLNRKKTGYGISSYGNQFFIVDNEKIHTWKNSEKYRSFLKLVVKYMSFTQKLEMKNRIWNINTEEKYHEVKKN